MAAAAATARWLNSAHRDIHFVLVPCQHVATMIPTTWGQMRVRNVAAHESSTVAAPRGTRLA